MGQWQIIFYTTAAVFLTGFIVYTLLGSGEEQPWNHSFDHKSDLEKQKLSEGRQRSETDQLEMNKKAET